MSKACGILYPGDEFKDHDGCIKPHAHNNAHVFNLPDGRQVEWEDDYSCKCGCWDEWEDSGEQVCLVYRIITPEQTKTSLP